MRHLHNVFSHLTLLFLLSFLLFKQTHAKPKRTHKHSAKPAAPVTQPAEGKGRVGNSRESGTVVGGEWEDHMHFSRLR